jgi:transposase
VLVSLLVYILLYLLINFTLTSIINAKNKYFFSGKRIERGLYKSSDGTLLNADANGAYNILRKTQDFSFDALSETVGSKIKQWLHPVKRIRFLNQKTHLISNF